jgi:filamentous hemagglutinin family protein
MLPTLHDCRRRRRAPRAIALLLLLLTLPPAALANPNGGVVQGGVATISGQGTAQVDVHQGSQSAVLSWQNFNIAPGEVTNFHQPNANATAINKILQQDPSKIFGALNANGNVYLINPNGFLFGSSATVNTRGFSASTSAEDLVKLGGYDASATSAAGARIENHGKISAGDGGFVYLVAPRIENGKDAVITTPRGEVLLAAGATVTLTDDPSGTGLGVKYTAPGQPGGEAVNLGKLVANGGFAKMRAEMVRQGGVVQANAVREKNGKVELYATRDLQLEAGSVTAATGGEGEGAGGNVFAYSEASATMHDGAVIDVSGGAQGGDGGHAELSAKDSVALEGGSFRAGAKAGSKRGSVLIDPKLLTISGSTSFAGAGDVVAEADERIQVSTNAVVALSNGEQYGDGTAARQSFTLRSGRHISFGSGSKIVDDGTGAGGQKVWDVNLVAGADLGSANLLATRSDSNGGVYLSGASFDSAGQVTRLLGNDGEVKLTKGNLTVRAPGDLVIGNGGGLKNETGGIDVAVGRDVLFRADSQTQDGVIENGSGRIQVSAGRDVLLVESAASRGNAAIRTRGVRGTNAQGQTTISNGGSIVIQAGRDVDSGLGNRWLEPGLNVTPEAYRRAYRELVAENPDLGLPPDVVASVFDRMPVVADGILGIGTEAGGDVTIVAGGSVRTGTSLQARSGGTAASLGTQYNGSHIGVFGRPVTRVLDSYNSIAYLIDPTSGQPTFRNVPIEGAPESRLTVVAGNAIEGDYAIRNGDATFRSGYALANGVSARTLDLANVDAGLVESAAALADPRAGWFGTLARPVTVDSMEASVFGRGRNGVAIRGIENPSLVYPRAINSSDGVAAVPTWRDGDGATLHSTHGDVILVGADTAMPTADSSTPVVNDLVRLLPPNVKIETDEGDLVLLNDFTLYPSRQGGLALDIAGSVRTAGLSASTSAVLSLVVETLGATGDLEFEIPVGTKLLDPESGIEYTLTTQLRVNKRVAAQPARGDVVFRVASGAANRTVTVKAGTRVATSDGRIYEVLADRTLLAPEQRVSSGSVTFFASDGGATDAIQIPSGTILTAADGTRFRVRDAGIMNPGATQVTLPVDALTPGVDAPALGLSLETPIAGVDRALNFAPTVRSTDIEASVIAVDAGAAGNGILPFEVTAILDDVPGVESVISARPFGGGADIAPIGTGTGPGTPPLVRANQLGPAGELPAGTRLVLADPSVLPAGADANEVSILIGEVNVPAVVTPALYRELRAGSDGTLRPDPEPGSVAILSATDAWIRSGGGISATIQQSDANPDVDARTGSGSFSYSDFFANGRETTHAGDSERSVLRALGGFVRVTIDLAKAAFALTGDAGDDGLFGTPDDGVDGSIRDFGLITQHSQDSDETLLWVPIGDASFGADAPAPGVAPDLLSGLQVAGPGSAKLLVGVLPNAPQVDTNANGRIDPEESTGDRDGVAGVDRDEWNGAPDVFSRIDESQREYLSADDPAIFRSRGLILPGGGDDILSAAETPVVPSGRGGSIRLAADLIEAPYTLGISAIGNARNTELPIGSAALYVAADGDIDLNGRGSIETYQGSRLAVQSVSGAVRGGIPPLKADGKSKFTGRRGIVTLFRPPIPGNTPATETGGGAIGVDAHGDVDVGGLALAALSGSDITIYSRDGSIDAGVSSPFSNPTVFGEGSGALLIDFEGGGIFANGGNVGLFAKQDIKIGAGISGAGITIDAGGSLVGGAGGISGTNVNIDVGGSISGSISASGSINVSGGSVAQGASLSAGGLVAGAGAGVGSNSGGNKASAELANLTGAASEVAAGGFQTAQAAATGERQVMIQVTSRVIGESEDEKDRR